MFVNGADAADDSRLLIMVYKQQRDSALDALANAQVRMVRSEQKIAQLEQRLAQLEQADADPSPAPPDDRTIQDHM